MIGDEKHRFSLIKDPFPFICPKCGSKDIETKDVGFDDYIYRKEIMRCGNCGHEYE